VARYRQYDYNQKRLIAVSFEDQIIPGTFEYALDYLIDNDVDLSIFEKRYHNDETGAPAYDPAILLKIVLYAYSRGVISSRKIEKLCQSHIIFIALSAESRPHFTTIANFVSSCENEIISVFRDILFVCDQEGLIGKDMFAIDGVKLPSNASKQCSGRRKDFKKKLSKLEVAIGEIIQKHRQMDLSQSESELYQSEKKRLERLRKNYNKIKSWLDENDDKISLAGNVVQSNITDNDSAKMDISHGVIQGYDGVAAVDSKQQVIVGA
jgi:transposase